MNSLKIGVRDLVTNLQVLDKYDFIELEDKKSKKLKGIFLSNQLAKEFYEFLESKKNKDIEQKLNFLNRFKGKGNGAFTNLTIQKIKENMDV